MRNYRYRKMAAARSGGGTKQDFWLSFSDLMSVLVLVFVLIMFYFLYKYFVIYAAYDEKLNDMALIQAALDSKQAELDAAQVDLGTAQSELEAAQIALTDRETALTEAQEELAAQQLLLKLAEEAVALGEEELATKQAELDAALLLLEQREADLELLDQQLTAQQTVLDDQQAQLEALVGVRTRIIREMSDSLKANNITATVDPESGAIVLASDVMFAYGSDELSDQGKAFINAFLPVYLSVLFDDANSGYVSEIIIEGHTDDAGGYVKNLQLSQERAFAVAEYVLSDEFNGLDYESEKKFTSMLTANGRSFSDPIYDANGYIDDAASRRVVFKFRLTDDQMIRQMQQILEASFEGEAGTEE